MKLVRLLKGVCPSCKAPLSVEEVPGVSNARCLNCGSVI